MLQVFSTDDQSKKTVNSCYMMQPDNCFVFSCSSVFIQSQRQRKVFTSGDRYRQFIVHFNQNFKQLKILC